MNQINAHTTAVTSCPTVLFVCTGNTCWSPMAEVIAHRLVEQGRWRINVASAGTFVRRGDAAAPEARLVAAEHALDLSQHRARQLTPELATTADLVVSMTERHAARAAWMGAKQVVVMSPPVVNPIGHGVEEYRRAWNALAVQIPRMLANHGCAWPRGGEVAAHRSPNLAIALASGSDVEAA